MRELSVVSFLSQFLEMFRAHNLVHELCYLFLSGDGPDEQHII